MKQLKCKKCEKILDEDRFHVERGNLSGRSGTCKTCRKNKARDEFDCLFNPIIHKRGEENFSLI